MNRLLGGMIAVAFVCNFAIVAKADMAVCTEMWCQEGLTVDLTGGTWPAGDYTFTVKADDKTVTCKGSLPFKTCDGAVTCDGEGVTIGESGCALPPEQHSFGPVILTAIPKSVDISVSRGDGKGFTVQQADITPECSYPNGSECDMQECCSAAIASDVLWR